MRYQVLTNPNYHADKHVEIDPTEVVSMEEKVMKILFGGTHRVTVVSLKDGGRYILVGHLSAEIEAARRQAGVAAVGSAKAD
ncbi:MAG: hypothetical protein JWN98_2766 [Abditibacteriota bacterium]|nr:hypothetical protein [Abditibacteriota bacterium]